MSDEFSPEEDSGNLLKIIAAAVIIVFVAGVVIFVVLSLMGPEVGNVFTNIINEL